MLQRALTVGGGGGGNAQFVKTTQSMGNSWTNVSIECSTDDLLMVYIQNAGRSSTLIANGDGTYTSINSSGYTNIKVENGTLQFMYTWTGPGLVHDVYYCYSI